MRVPRIYQQAEFSPQQKIMLSAEAARHLIQVLRLSIDDQIILFDGQGNEYQAVISRIEKKHVTAIILEKIINTIESPLSIHLGQAVSRGEKMDYTIQKAVELGVNEITPLLTERCGVKLTDDRWEKRLMHWKSVIIAACEQSGRNYLPIIHAPLPINQWLLKTNVECKIVLHPFAQKKLNMLSIMPKSIALLIGSEGGLTEAEINLAQQQNFVSLQLGPRILRTETAGVAAIAVLQNHFGDMK